MDHQKQHEEELKHQKSQEQKAQKSQEKSGQSEHKSGGKKQQQQSQQDDQAGKAHIRYSNTVEEGQYEEGDDLSQDPGTFHGMRTATDPNKAMEEQRQEQMRKEQERSQAARDEDQKRSGKNQ